MNRPILYTFRRCPYAIRARMALAYAGVNYEVREVLLRDKPNEMLQLSPKGTVPVLLEDGGVLDESLDIVAWALTQCDSEGWLKWDAETLRDMAHLIDECENEFKPELDGYKYSSAEKSRLAHRDTALTYLQTLEQRISIAMPMAHSDCFLFGPRMSYADVCIFPFVRQFAHVDKAWFDALPYPKLQHWLAFMLHSPLFLAVMTKYPQWHEGAPLTLAATPQHEQNTG